MTLLAATPTDPGLLALGQIVVAALLGIAGVYFLLPRPRHRRLALGVFLCLAAVAVLVVFLVSAFGQPWHPDVIGQVLFWLFAAGAVLFGTMLVVQRNPARGAIAFAFVILSSCGLFLLLAAPFLMAATVIIYAGAIIVTFLFLLMLSHKGPSDENDRSREPLLGSLAGFAFTGLVLFALYLGSPFSAASERFGLSAKLSANVLPAEPLTAADRSSLAAAVAELDRAAQAKTRDELEPPAQAARSHIAEVVGTTPGEAPAARKTVQERLRFAGVDRRVWGVIEQADKLRAKKKDVYDRLDNNLLARNPNLEQAKADLRSLRDDVVLFLGNGLLPARDVAAIGYSLYSEYLIAVEMAGTLLLVATIGAVAIAGRKRETP
jgi:NADH:ubiquinone oxidoreductase subunit 6 (subunit J)